MPLFYHKTDSLSWIDGSIRVDLIPDERSIWADLMALAGLTREPRRGYIERSEGIPYDKQALLARLVVTEELFDRAVAKCVKEGRLQVFPDGTMLLTNWVKYNDTTEYKKKKEAQQQGVERGLETQRRRKAIDEALLKAVNTFNTRLLKARYILNEDGDYVDTTNGEKISQEELAVRLLDVNEGKQ